VYKERRARSLPAPVRALTPTFSSLAAIARKRGIDRELVSRYCRV
jgi:hypothetical protein